LDGALVKEGGVSYLTLPVGARDHTQGFMGAAVTMLEYGDFASAHCAEGFPVVKETARWLRGELCYVFRHFPIVETNPHALLAAEAAEAAGAQGRFWEMHDLLCERSPALGEIHLKSYAKELDLDMERFERETQARVYLQRVREDYESGVASGVTRTPAFFINGVLYKGQTDLDSLLAAIEEAGTSSHK
jgi:protein-disulfide isomerase